jgi:hypothetical protein
VTLERVEKAPKTTLLGLVLVLVLGPVAVFPLRSRRPEDELIWRWLDAALGATPSL